MPPTVLIVDDDAGFRRLAGMVLEDHGFLVVGEAEDGAQAVARAARLRPDCVLLDVHLPDTDGYAVARALRDGDSSPKVLLTSTDTAAGAPSAVADCGADGFVAKVELGLTDLRSYLV